MRRTFNWPIHKRQAPSVTGRRVARRHDSGRAQKARPWAPWVRPISIYAILNGAGPLADLAGDPDRPSPGGRR